MFDSLKLLRRIYNLKTANNCSSEFCKCTQTSYDSSNIDSSDMFRNEIYIAQVQRIVSAFVEKFKLFYSSNYRQTLDSYLGRNDLPTLVEFFLRNEISMSRLIIYNATIVPREFPGFLDRRIYTEVF